MTIRKERCSTRFPFIDFFAGSGLVSEALKQYFFAAWANDFSEKKACVYKSNHSSTEFFTNSIENVNGKNLPYAVLSWASFPCQDVSLAGLMNGIKSSRSGMVWQWLRVMDEMRDKPPLIVAENVVGLISSSEGENYIQLHNALVNRGYRVGAMVLDAKHWIPQSRPRVFIVGIDEDIDISEYTDKNPSWHHPECIKKISKKVKKWVFWKLPPPSQIRATLDDIFDKDALFDDDQTEKHNLNLIKKSHFSKMVRLTSEGVSIFPGYKRTRDGKQVLELRFDGIAGCLRTPKGWSSRQLFVVWKESKFHTRLISALETKRLMGAKDGYVIPGGYNDSYMAMGDAVAVPVVEYLAKHLLYPLASSIISQRGFVDVRKEAI